MPRLTALALEEAGTFWVLKVRDHLRGRAAPIDIHVNGSPEDIQEATSRTVRGHPSKATYLPVTAAPTGL